MKITIVLYCLIVSLLLTTFGRFFTRYCSDQSVPPDPAHLINGCRGRHLHPPLYSS